eukprot:scaffold10597_cov124-Isochrysis_galbana.AAC.11
MAMHAGINTQIIVCYIGPRVPLPLGTLYSGARARARAPSLGATRRCGAAYEAAWPGCRDSDDSGRRRRRPDHSNEPGRRLSDRMAMPVLHGQAYVRHSGSRQRTALAGGHAEQVEAALQCAIRGGPT